MLTFLCGEDVSSGTVGAITELAVVEALVDELPPPKPPLPDALFIAATPAKP